MQAVGQDEMLIVVLCVSISLASLASLLVTDKKLEVRELMILLAMSSLPFPRDIFETVVAGFAAVSSDPIENVKKIAAKKKAAELGIELEEDNDGVLDKKNNQIILAVLPTTTSTILLNIGRNGSP